MSRRNKLLIATGILWVLSLVINSWMSYERGWDKARDYFAIPDGIYTSLPMGIMIIKSENRMTIRIVDVPNKAKKPISLKAGKLAIAGTGDEGMRRTIP